MTYSCSLNSGRPAPDLHRPWFQEQHLSLTPSTLIGQLSDEALLAGKSSAMLICYKICFQILYHTLPWTLLPSQWLMEDKPDREDNKSAEVNVTSYHSKAS